MATLDIRDLHVSVNTDEGPVEILRGEIGRASCRERV